MYSKIDLTKLIFPQNCRFSCHFVKSATESLNVVALDICVVKLD
jgi:hypothetical protein